MGYGLGKKRTLLGEFIDNNPRLSQELLAKEAKKGRNTISQLCTDNGKPMRRPQLETQAEIVQALRRLGYKVKQKDFWP